MHEDPQTDSRPVLPAPGAAESGEVASRRARELRAFHFAPPRPEAAKPPLAGEYLPAAGRGLAEAPAEGSAGGDRWDAVVEEVVAALPPAARCSAQAALHLFAHAVRGQQRPARADFKEATLALVARGRALVESDHSKDSGSHRDDAFGRGLGALGPRLVDPASLLEMLGSRDGGVAMAASRRQRIEEDLATLGQLAGTGRPELILVHERGLEGIDGLDTLDEPAASEPAAGGWRISADEDPCAAAARLFDQQAEELARLLRAVRRLGLELDGDYRPELHGPWLEQLDWQAFSRDELRLLPSVVALVSADQVAGDAMPGLSRLLLSGRPAQVFVLTRPAAATAVDDPRLGFRFEPSFFALSHREALVWQTAAARPAHMMRGFSRALAGTRAGLHVISLAEPAGEHGIDLAGLDVAVAAELAGRVHPLFGYDPEAGSDWTERFDCSPNPQVEQDWPVYELEVRRHDGGETTLRLPFTFADFALLDPSYGGHYALVPESMPEDGLVPLASYCARPLAEEDPEIPFIWGVDGGSRLRRLAVSRPLALACRDRLGFWRALRELAGVSGGRARRDAEEAQRRAEEEARQENLREELERLRASAGAELERARGDAVRQVVDGLTAALLEVDVASFATPFSAPAALAIGGPLGGHAGAGVEGVSAALLALVDVATLNQESAAADLASDDGRIAEVTSRLLGLLGGETRAPGYSTG